MECATLAVQLPVPPTQHTCCALLHALLKHLLYARGHIPCLYDTMLDIALAEQQAAAGGLEECQQQSLLRPRVRQSRPKRVDKRRLQVGALRRRDSPHRGCMAAPKGYGLDTITDLGICSAKPILDRLLPQCSSCGGQKRC